MHSQIYSGLSLIFGILRNFRVADAQGSLWPAFHARRVHKRFLPAGQI